MENGRFDKFPEWLYTYDKLTDSEKLVYMKIRSLAKQQGAWISNDSLAKLFNKDVSTIKRYIQKLEKLGLIERDTTCKKGYIKQRLIRIKDFTGCTDEPRTGCTDEPRTGCTDEPRTGCTDEPSTDKVLTDKKEQIKNPKKKRAVKKKYGRYENVPFTDEQLEKLKEEFPRTWEERIEKVSVWADSKGKTVKDGLATIRNWARKNNDYEQTKQQATERDDWL